MIATRHSRVILLQPPHRRALRVLDLDPSLAPAGSIRRISALRHDPFKPELARMPEHPRSITSEMLRESNPLWSRQQPAELGAPVIKPLASDVRSINRQQIESVQEHAPIVRAGMKALEIGNAIRVAADPRRRSGRA
jgi:hypothetical protein